MEKVIGGGNKSPVGHHIVRVNVLGGQAGKYKYTSGVFPLNLHACSTHKLKSFTNKIVEMVLVWV